MLFTPIGSVPGFYQIESMWLPRAWRALSLRQSWWSRALRALKGKSE